MDALGKAREVVLVQAYSFTSAPIAKALLDAQKRGVHVYVILDKSNLSEKYTEADFLLHAGVPTWIDAKHQIAHNKIMVIDRATILPGSFICSSNPRTRIRGAMIGNGKSGNNEAEPCR